MSLSFILKYPLLIMSDVGSSINADRGAWKFDGNVVDNFQEHVTSSVPLYNEGHDMICMLSDYFCQDGSYIYDIGCSKGELIKRLAQYNNKSLNLVGIESEPIFAKASSVELLGNNKMEGKILNHKIKILNENILDLTLQESSLITSYYTIQFIHPRYRQDVFDKIYSSLHWGGAFILFEKVRANDARFQDIISQTYLEYKTSRGFSKDEVMSKLLSLKGILEPFTSQENNQYMKRAGFVDIISISKFLCFEGWLAIK